MLQEIQQILNAANPQYKVIYEENHMMNIKADELALNSRFVHIEEFTRGQYTSERYFETKTVQMQIYFCRFVEMEADAIVREGIRNEIESEIVEPFIRAYKESNLFASVDNWAFFYPLPRWDANEVGIMLQFPCKVSKCQ